MRTLCLKPIPAKKSSSAAGNSSNISSISVWWYHALRPNCSYLQFKATYLHGTYLPTCYYHGELCVIERVDDKYTEGLKRDKLKALLQGGPEVTLLRGAAEYSRLRTKLWEHVKQRPMIRHSMSWSSTPPSTVKVTLIGPLCPLGDSLVIVKSKTLYSSVSELNGPGLLPSVCISLSRGANDKWLKMPHGNCFDSIDKFPNESDMYMIAKRLARGQPNPATDVSKAVLWRQQAVKCVLLGFT